jgi:hypothetical protein
MSCTITKAYVLANLNDATKLPNIYITSVDELRLRGQFTLFCTGDVTEVTMTVADRVHRHHFAGHEAFVVSPIDGTATALSRHRKLFYPRDFDAQTPHDLKEKSEILADLAAIYNVASTEVRLASYHQAHALATAKRKGVHAARALQAYAPTLLFPPNVALHDDQHSTTGSSTRSPSSPVIYMVFKFWLPCTTTSMLMNATNSFSNCSTQWTAWPTSRRISPGSASSMTSPAFIRVAHFTGEGRTTPPAREAESEQPEPNPHLATPLWPQFVALGAINSTTASGSSSLSDTSFFRPRGLRVAVLQATYTLAILALYFLTVHPDSIVDVFSHYPATNIYDSVPVSQRHRLLLHPLDPANVSTSALQLSQYRSIREIDLFHIEDPEADQCAHVYGLLKLAITDLSPDVVITTRTT